MSDSRGSEHGGRQRRIEADVCVVGAGLSGITAAAELERRGLTVAVLEARERIGGRLLNEPIGRDEVTELGGQYFGPHDRNVIALARSLGVPAFKTFTEGEKQLELAGRRVRFRGAVPRLPLPVMLDFAQGRLRLDRLARGVDSDAPWTAAKAGELDAQTLGSWARRAFVTRRARSLLAIASRGVWAAEPEEQSLLYALAYVSFGGKLTYLTETGGGAQDSRLAGGSARLVDEQARQLRGPIALGAPVTGIEQRGDRVTLTGPGPSATARSAIVALPPHLAARIAYDPPLPAARDLLHARMSPAAAIKCLAIYDEPFWRAHGFNGQAASDRPPVTAVFDNSPPSGRPGVLVGFVVGAAARELSRLGERERRRRVLAVFERFFGSRAAAPQRYIEKDWTADPWSRGCYFAYAPPGTVSSLWPLRHEPAGLVHWAGAETATRGYGGMNGAIEAGWRTAREVAARIGPVRAAERETERAEVLA